MCQKNCLSPSTIPSFTLIYCIVHSFGEIVLVHMKFVCGLKGHTNSGILAGRPILGQTKLAVKICLYISKALTVPCLFTNSNMVYVRENLQNSVHTYKT